MMIHDDSLYRTKIAFIKLPKIGLKSKNDKYAIIDTFMKSILVFFKYNISIFNYILSISDILSEEYT